MNIIYYKNILVILITSTVNPRKYLYYYYLSDWNMSTLLLNAWLEHAYTTTYCMSKTVSTIYYLLFILFLFFWLGHVYTVFSISNYIIVLQGFYNFSQYTTLSSIFKHTIFVW